MASPERAWSSSVFRYFLDPHVALRAPRDGDFHSKSICIFFMHKSCDGITTTAATIDHHLVMSQIFSANQGPLALIAQHRKRRK